MYKVAICDDEVELGIELEETLLGIFKKLKAEGEIDVFLTGEKICEAIRGGAFYHLIFLDINFAKSDFSGINVGEFVRDSCQNNRTAIVYMSWEKSYALQLFKIRPMDFLIKPLDNDGVENAVRTFLRLSKDWSKDFTYNKGSFTFKRQVKEIVCLEKRNRKIIIHLAQGGREEFNGSLKRIYKEQLEELDFLFVNAHFVINFDYVTSLGYKEIFVEDKATSISIDYRKKERVKERYFEIVKRRGKKA